MAAKLVTLREEDADIWQSLAPFFPAKSVYSIDFLYVTYVVCLAGEILGLHVYVMIEIACP